MDVPSNLQWQDVMAAREKDRLERAGCAWQRRQDPNRKIGSTANTSTPK